MTERGYVQAIVAYLLWGLFPLYWKLLSEIPSNQIVAYRVTISAVMLGAAGLLTTRVDLRRAFGDRRTLAVHAVSALLIGTNWLAFLYAVAVDRVVESSLGYFMTPLVSVVLAMVVLRERLTSWQWLAVAFAAVGVAVLTIEAGVVPWIAFTLAGSFGLYGLVRKLSPLPSIEGLASEVVLLAVPASLFLGSRAAAGELVVPGGWRFAVLLTAGIVTVTPLLLFAAAARSIPLSAVGILLYINPLMQFVLGAFVFDERVTAGRFAGFAVIWVGLVIFAYDGWRRRPRAAVVPTERTEPGSVVVVEPAPGLAAE
ncbi:MAG: EamA family transporter RarD [Acidimicrobiales bacterium]